MPAKLQFQKANLHNALVIARAIQKLGGRAEVGQIRAYYSDEESLLDAVFYAREYGYIETEHMRIGRATEVWLTGRFKGNLHKILSKYSKCDIMNED